MKLLSELRRRNVLRMVALYAVAAWLIAQVAEVLITLGNWPEWIGTTTLSLLAVGFPIALVCSWFFGFTPDGIGLEKNLESDESISRGTYRPLDLVLMSFLVAAVILFAIDKWWIEGPPDSSIAVLPFINMSDAEGNEYFADGLTEEILNLIAKVPELRVTSRTSAFSFKGEKVDIPTVAASLNVAHVLEGSVRRSGDKIRITAQLIDARSDVHIWSETYDRTLYDIFAVQDDIAATVMQELKLNLLGELPKVTQTDPEAYAMFLEARYFSFQRSRSGLKRAEELYKAVLDIDPEYAPAWVRLAAVYNNLTSLGERDNSEGHALAREAVQRALEIDDQNADALAQLAWITMVYDWDFPLADRQIQKALEIDSGNEGILSHAATLAQILGRLIEAIDLKEQAVDRDPVRASRYSNLGNAYYYAGRYREATKTYEHALLLSPRIVGVKYNLARVWLAQGDYETALAVAQEEPDEGWRLQGSSLAKLELSERETADALLAELIEKYADEMAYQIAETYAYRNEVNPAFSWLEQAFENRDGGLTEILVDPLFVNIHDDPRWDVFLDKMGLLQ